MPWLPVLGCVPAIWGATSKDDSSSIPPLHGTRNPNMQLWMGPQGWCDNAEDESLLQFLPWQRFCGCSVHLCHAVNWEQFKTFCLSHANICDGSKDMLQAPLKGHEGENTTKVPLLQYVLVFLWWIEYPATGRICNVSQGACREGIVCGQWIQVGFQCPNVVCWQFVQGYMMSSKRAYPPICHSRLGPA